MERGIRGAEAQITQYSYLRWLKTQDKAMKLPEQTTAKHSWLLSQNELQAVRSPCHLELHRNQKIPHLDINGNEIGLLTPCYRCAGAGEFPEFYHVEEGVCFTCHGAKYEEFFS
jgi:hypothetical protein